MKRFYLLFVALSKRFAEHGRSRFKGVKPFSWQSALLLSLLAWCVYLLVQDYDLKRLVEFFGWLFLIIGTDWALIEQEGKAKKAGTEFKVPLLGLKIRYSPWVTGALVTLALLSFRFIITDARSAFVGWPLISAALAALPRFLKPGPKFKRLNELDPPVRQDLVILSLIAILLSCWFEFAFQVQDLLQQYPSIRADNLSRSAFVVQFNRSAVAPSGVEMLEAAEDIVRRQLSQQPWSETQRWLQNINAAVPQLDAQIKAAVFGDPPRFRESQAWAFNAQYRNGIPDNVLQLQAIWNGPSSQTGGYQLQQNCLIGPPPVQSIVPAPPTGTTASYRLDCQRITSTNDNIQVAIDQAENPIQRFFRSLQRSVQRLFGRREG